ncbi:hypothetical protein BDM02DRAFT_1413867 [Thelephora ganbajun]|uniref:Uncharacterized protein n=1 Tax=Thelephora ganbajun TaxID=370292 RepID=A0ACB6Z207_THEGA|nr:hypothetical protein BDM02DRAFT_1413867 [Thelephora ganbajun]
MLEINPHSTPSSPPPGVASSIGTMSIITHEERLRFARLTRFRGEEVHLSHSRLACLRQSITSNAPHLRLRVLHLPLKCKRREGDPDVVREYSKGLIPASKEIFSGKSYLST